jgi:hypothetical protein
MSYLEVAITIYENFERNINNIKAMDAIRGYV